MAKEQAAMEWCVEANEGNSFSDSVRDKNPRVVMPSTAKPSLHVALMLRCCYVGIYYLAAARAHLAQTLVAGVMVYDS